MTIKTQNAIVGAPRTMDQVLCELQACKRQRAALQAIVDAADQIVNAATASRDIARLDAAIANARAILRGEAS